MSRNTSKFYQLEHSFWTRKKTRQIAQVSTDALYLYLYLLSSPANNRIGIMELSFEQVAKHTGLDFETCQSCLQELIQLEVCQYDDCMGFVWLPEILDAVFRKGHNDKHLIGLHKEIERLIYEETPLAEEAQSFCMSASNRFMAIYDEMKCD